jgi:hypothetical protein
MNPKEKKKNPPKKKKSEAPKQEDPKPIPSSEDIGEGDEVNLPPTMPPESMRQ